MATFSEAVKTLLTFLIGETRVKRDTRVNMGNRYMQRIMLPQSVVSLPTSVAVSADYYTNQLVCNSSRGLKQSLVILSFDPLLNCVFDDPSI